MECVARGWESKDVESQRELAQADRRIGRRPPRTTEQIERARELANLRLDRTRLTADLKRPLHPRHRAQLEAALAYVNQQMDKVTKSR